MASPSSVDCGSDSVAESSDPEADLSMWSTANQQEDGAAEGVIIEARSVSLDGVWMSPGQPNKKLNLLYDGKIVFGELDGSFTSPPHGAHYEITTSVGSCRVVCFHHHGEDSMLVAHTLYHIHSGLWRSAKQWETWLDITSFTVSPVALPESLLGVDYMSRAKHKMMWLHPGREPQYLFLLNDNTVVWSNGVENGPANGCYDYYGTPESSNALDRWVVNYHCTGEEAKAQYTALERVHGNEIPVWRAIGSLALRNFEDEMMPMVSRYGAKDVRAWHIIMLSI